MNDEPSSPADGTSSRVGALRGGPEVRGMFGRIVPRYDLMNRLMTGGRDAAWRRLAVRAALDGRPPGTSLALDVATGTGDLALALAAGGARGVVGVDFAAPMIAAAAAKSRRGSAPSPGVASSAPPPSGANEGPAESPALPAKPKVGTRRDPIPPAPGDGQADGGRERNAVSWVVGDALALPFADRTFAACTVSFGLRNMADYRAALRELTRVLEPGGRLVCLELTPYRVPVLGRVFGWYFSRVVPLVGGLLSGDRDAYRYLPSSVAAFPPAAELAGLMREAGLTDAGYRLLGGGAVALHVGSKPAGEPGV